MDKKEKEMINPVNHPKNKGVLSPSLWRKADFSSSWCSQIIFIPTLLSSHLWTKFKSDNYAVSMPHDSVNKEQNLREHGFTLNKQIKICVCLTIDHMSLIQFSILSKYAWSCWRLSLIDIYYMSQCETSWYAKIVRYIFNNNIASDFWLLKWVTIKRS